MAIEEVPLVGKDLMTMEEEALTQCIQGREGKVQPIPMDLERTLLILFMLLESLLRTHTRQEKPTSQGIQVRKEERELMALKTIFCLDLSKVTETTVLSHQAM